jgi:Uri superfamily endonuclease
MTLSTNLPPLPGTYALVLRLAEAKPVTVGRLGCITFPAGDYVYLGSALGPGGLHARVRRHTSPAKRVHWHIDHLLAEAELTDVHAVPGNVRLECTWSASLSRLPDAKQPADDFGASDCRCHSHLVHFASGVTVEQLEHVLVGSPRHLVEGLRRAVSAQDDNECEIWCQALVKHPDIVPTLRPLLADTDEDLRWWTVQVLLATGRAQAASLLVHMLSDRDDAVRGSAVLALGLMGSVEAVEALANLMDDDSGWLRQLAALGLALIGEPAVPVLQEALQSTEEGLRVRASYALSRIRSPTATGSLLRALNDPNYVVNAYAQEALERMGLLDVVLVA